MVFKLLLSFLEPSLMGKTFCRVPHQTFPPERLGLPSTNCAIRTGVSIWKSSLEIPLCYPIRDDQVFLTPDFIYIYFFNYLTWSVSNEGTVWRNTCLTSYYFFLTISNCNQNISNEQSHLLAGWSPNIFKVYILRSFGSSMHSFPFLSVGNSLVGKKITLISLAVWCVTASTRWMQTNSRLLISYILTRY